MTTLAYLDASAIVKLVLAEPESVEMARWYVESERVSTSLVGIIETRRAVARRAHDPVDLARVLGGIEVVGVTPRIGERAAAIAPSNGCAPSMRSTWRPPSRRCRGWMPS